MDTNNPSLRVLFVADERATHMKHWAAALSRRGFQVGYASFGHLQGEHPHSVFRVKPLLGNHYAKFIVSAPRVARVVARFRPDIVHGYYLTNYGLLATLSSAKRVVVTVAGSDLFVETTRTPLLQLISRFVCARADLLHSVADHMTRALYRFGASRGKLFTIPEGVDLNVFTPYVDDAKSRKPVVVCTRNFRPVYDVATLVRAIPAVLRERPDVTFVLIGDGPERASAQRLAQALGVEANVHFVGYLPWDSLAAYLRAASVYVSPSLSDGTSASLLQAMVSGAFPVVSDIPANREWVENGRDGLLFPVRDYGKLAQAILHALSAPSLRGEAARRNRDRIVREVSDEVMIDRLLVAYSKILG